MSALSVNAQAILRIEGKDCTYHHAASGTKFPWRAAMGATTRQVTDAGGGKRYIRLVDFLGDPSLLAVEGVPIEPDRKDKIELTVGATNYVYQVLPESELPSSEPSDPEETLIRIHTKRVG